MIFQLVVLILVLTFIAVLTAVFPLLQIRKDRINDKREGFLELNDFGVQMTCTTTARYADDFGRPCDFMHPRNKLCIGGTCITPEQWYDILIAEGVIRNRAADVRTKVETHNVDTRDKLRDKINNDFKEIRNGSLALLEGKEGTALDLHKAARARDKVTHGSPLGDQAGGEPAILVRHGDRVYSKDGYMYHEYTQVGENDINVARQVKVDMFLVGGGGGTSRNSGWHGAAGAGGGYAYSYYDINLPKGRYHLTVGRGGDGNEDGRPSVFNLGRTAYEAPGGKKNVGRRAGDGGSGGGGGTGSDSSGNSGSSGRGGSDGGNGNNSKSASGGSGQNASTRAFNQRKNDNGNWETIDSGSSAELYGGGGSGGGVLKSYWEFRRVDGTIPGGEGGGGDAVSDSFGMYSDRSSMSRQGRQGEDGKGGGAGGSNTGRPDAKGGSGIIIVRYKHDDPLPVTGAQENYQKNGKWHFKFTKTGEMTVNFHNDMEIDVFLVGGGGGTSRNNGWHGAAGAGGGYARSYYKISVARGRHTITVGKGGDGDEHGHASRFQIDGGSLYTAEGGRKNIGRKGGDGGSGGGGGTGSDSNGNSEMEGRGGSDGKDGNSSSQESGGKGQGFSTREFNQKQNSDGEWETIDESSSAKMYGGGGSGGGVLRSYWESRGNGEIPGGSGGGGDAVSRAFGNFLEPESARRQRQGENGLGGGAGGSQTGNPDASGGHGVVIIREA